MATSVLPTVIEPWVQIFVPQPCYDTFFVDLNFFNVLCLKVVLSKCLGFGVIMGSLMVKLPQIVKIVRAKSAEGLSLMGVFLELTAISATAAYGFAHSFPFSAYGEALFLGIQTVTIGFLVLFYNDNVPMACTFLGVYGALMTYLLSPYAPLALLTTIQGFNILIVLASKLVQANANYQNGSTGQLSAVTVAMLFLGSIARIFTSAQETGDMLIVITYIVATLSNGLILAQIFYYARAPQKQKHM